MADLAGNAWSQDGCRGNYATIDQRRPGVRRPVTGADLAFTPGFGVDKCDVAVYTPAVDKNALKLAPKARYYITAGGMVMIWVPLT